MVAKLTISHRAARNQASLDQAHAGAGAAACIKFFTAEGGTLLAVRNLAHPCGVITAVGRISLAPAATTDLVLTTGTPTWGEWCNRDGDAIWGATVTSESGDGPFKLKGTASGVIYEGGILELELPALLG